MSPSTSTIYSNVNKSRYLRIKAPHYCPTPPFRRYRDVVLDNRLLISIYFFSDACINGKTVSGTNGTIQSPNYPNMYPRNSNCNWTIETPANTVGLFLWPSPCYFFIVFNQPHQLIPSFQRISVKFEVLYEIEGYSPGCPYDYVAILDGSNELVILIIILVIRNRLNTPNQELDVRYDSDWSNLN